MSNSFWIYLITRLDIFIGLSMAFAIISALFTVVTYAWKSMEFSEDYEGDRIKIVRANKTIKLSLRICIIFTVVASLLPSSKEAIMIYAGGKTMDYIQQDTSLQKIPYKATEIVIKKMDEYLNEGEKEVEKENKEK